MATRYGLHTRKPDLTPSSLVSKISCGVSAGCRPPGGVVEAHWHPGGLHSSLLQA